MSKVLVVHKKSAWEMYLASPDEAVRSFAEHDEALRRSHLVHTASLEQVLRVLDGHHVEYETATRRDLQGISLPHQLIIAVGGDGTILDTTHYVPNDEIPILGVNSDPATSVGFYSCCTAAEFESLFAQVTESPHSIPRTVFPRLQVHLNGQKLPEYVLNDVLVAHSSPAAYTRYELTVDGRTVTDHRGNSRLRSSGLVIATAGGSTAWMYNLGGSIMPLSSPQLQYHERDIRNVHPHFGHELRIKSITREGNLFIDGEHVVYPFTVGDLLTISSGPAVQLVGNIDEKRHRYDDSISRQY